MGVSGGSVGTTREADEGDARGLPQGEGDRLVSQEGRFSRGTLPLEFLVPPAWR